MLSVFSSSDNILSPSKLLLFMFHLNGSAFYTLFAETDTIL